MTPLLTTKGLSRLETKPSSFRMTSTALWRRVSPTSLHLAGQSQVVSRQKPLIRSHGERSAASERRLHQAADSGNWVKSRTDLNRGPSKAENSRSSHST